MHIFHIVSASAWEAAVVAGSYRAESVATEGFIHFSYAAQVAETANRHYHQVDGLLVLEVDPALIASAIRVEPSPATGELFPHLYDPLPVEAVVATYPLNRDDAGRYTF